MQRLGGRALLIRRVAIFAIGAVASLGCTAERDATLAPTLAPRAPAAIAPARSLPEPPALPPFAVPRRTPALQRQDKRLASVSLAQTTFFNGEIALSNAYFLRFPNGTVFGTYGYGASDRHFVYHFDLSNGDAVNGWEYVFDSPDQAHPEYAFFYDFQSAHFWYTNATLFPYLYDFSLHSWIYYFPDATDATHQRYTSRPRYFSNMTTGAIITIPSADVTPASLSFTTTGRAAAQQFFVSEANYAGSFAVDATQCGDKAAVSAAPTANAFAVTPLTAGSCNLIVTDSKGSRAGVNVSISPSVPSPSPLPAGALSVSWQGNGSFATAAGATTTVLPTAAAKSVYAGTIAFGQVGQSATISAAEAGGPVPTVVLGYFNGNTTACAGNVTLVPAGASTFTLTDTGQGFSDCAVIVFGSASYGLELFYRVTGPVSLGGGV